MVIKHPVVTYNCGTPIVSILWFAYSHAIENPQILVAIEVAARPTYGWKLIPNLMGQGSKKANPISTTE